MLDPSTRVDGDKKNRMVRSVCLFPLFYQLSLTISLKNNPLVSFGNRSHRPVSARSCDYFFLSLSMLSAARCLSISFATRSPICAAARPASRSAHVYLCNILRLPFHRALLSGLVTCGAPLMLHSTRRILIGHGQSLMCHFMPVCSCVLWLRSPKLLRWSSSLC